MQVVLVRPEIPQNTGSIARTCAATQTPLHLVGPIGFEISERTVRRAGLDYWPFVQLSQHTSWDEYLLTAKPTKVWLLTKFGKRIYHDAPFGPEDAIVFGSETKGLGKEFLDTFPDEQKLRIPITCSGVRSLNLSNAVSIVLYEARRQLKLDEPSR
jgi:tRNA (cytidine/uridine-2'-O-)-methyltransferase